MAVSVDARLTKNIISQAHMPKSAPLEMPVQDLSSAPFLRSNSNLWDMRRWGVFAPALIGTVLMIWGLHRLFAEKGLTSLEYLLLGLIGMTFVWVTLAVSTAVIGLVSRPEEPTSTTEGGPLRVALLMPIYNESPSEVFGNAAAMLADLTANRGQHSFDLFVLSDSRDEAIAAAEWQAYQALKSAAPQEMSVFYRRRDDNTDKKVGNLVDWITGWGAAYEAMIVLDADSLMTGRAIGRLTQEMSADPKSGLIQSFPQLIAANTLFARLQQFSHTAYGWLLGEGLAAWARSEGNYWGHNAIIRTHAFASAAGLPRLRNLRGREDIILSHDFVEASLLRRSGWRVRFMPRLSGSFEETPGTLIDYVLRDRRWCRGNLQHLRLLGTAGLHPVSRFHLFQGAAAYLMSPAWFILLVFWALLGRDSQTNVITYFNEVNPLFPNWPPAMTHVDSMLFLMVMYSVLLAPKIAGAVIIGMDKRGVRLYGGRLAFLSAFLVEVALSVAYAPILMIQQTKAVLRSIFTRSDAWSPQQRQASAYPLKTLIGFHWLETLLGVLLSAGLIAGLVSFWLSPIVVSLLLAVPLSALSAVPLSRRLPLGLRLETPLSLKEPPIVRKARVARGAMADHLEQAAKIPAE